MSIRVINKIEISNGSLVKVVMYGRLQVLLRNLQATIRGYWCGVSGDAGKMYRAVTVPSTTEHDR